MKYYKLLKLANIVQNGLKFGFWRYIHVYLPGLGMGYLGDIVVFKVIWGLFGALNLPKSMIFKTLLLQL